MLKYRLAIAPVLLGSVLLNCPEQPFHAWEKDKVEYVAPKPEWGNCSIRRGATYYSAICQGTGRFRAVAGCYNADGQFVQQDFANAAYGLATPIEPHVSDDNCPFGLSPKSVTVQSA